jgi:hypothetical protein
VRVMDGESKAVYRIYLRTRFKSGVEGDQYFGPYSTRSAAQGQATELRKRCENYNDRMEEWSATVEVSRTDWESVDD